MSSSPFADVVNTDVLGALLAIGFTIVQVDDGQLERLPCIIPS